MEWVHRAEGPPGSGVIASGSAQATSAGAAVLAAGGSAVDAALAASFAAAVSEPALTSLGGGGFLLHATADGEAEVLDFFTSVPGLGGAAGAEADVRRVALDFAAAGPGSAPVEQVFHGGWGTVAVPGCFTGYLAAHRRWGQLPLADLVAPAAALARAGTGLSEAQRSFVHLVIGLLTLTEGGQRLFAPVEAGGAFRNPGYADLLDSLADGSVQGPRDDAYAGALLDGSLTGGGLLTGADLDGYRAEARVPLALVRPTARLLTNPPPSAGGTIIAEVLSEVLDSSDSAIPWSTVAASLWDCTARHRRRGQVNQGTTHVSVIDGRGRMAALSSSAGAGSGTVVPRWDVPLNNMLGEDDLRPDVPLPAGARLASMMAPTLIESAGGGRTVLGTGGSERIRSSLVCVMTRLLLSGASLAEAIAAPRVHVDGSVRAHVERGLGDDDVDDLRRLSRSRGWHDVVVWPDRALYFGGVHGAQRHADGSVEAVADRRRGGVAAAVLPDGTVVAGE